MKTMKAYRLQHGVVVLTEVPIPPVGPYDALIKIKQTSVCGTDVQIFQQDDWAKANVPDGTIPGHEGAGEIIALGEKARGFSVGDFVALESHYACDACLAAGKSLDDCKEQGIVGVYGILQADGKRLPPRSGTYAEFVSMPVSSLHKVPKQLLEQFQTSILEPVGNSWKIAQHFRSTRVPKTAIVFGCGPHGIFAQMFLRHIGARVIAVDPNELRRKFAQTHSADFAVMPEALPALMAEHQIVPDAALDITGAPGVVEQCLSLVKPQGTAVMFGLPKSSAQNIDGVPYDKIIFESRNMEVMRAGKKVQVIGFNGRSMEGWRTLIAELTESSALRSKLMETVHRIGSLEQLPQVIADARAKKLSDHKLAMTGF